MFFIVISYMLRCDVRLASLLPLLPFTSLTRLIEENKNHPSTNPVQHGIHEYRQWQVTHVIGNQISEDHLAHR